MKSLDDSVDDSQRPQRVEPGLEPETIEREPGLERVQPSRTVTRGWGSLKGGEDEQLLWELADEMDPEDSCLWIHGTEDQQTIAFTPAGMEYLRELLAEHKRNRPPRGTERMVSFVTVR